MKKYYIITGYMGSGSSAVTDLLSELNGIAVPNGDFEYVFLHTPDGVFDLEDKLLLGNNALRSDEAIHRFLRCMEDLYDKKHYGVGGYDKKISPQFIDYVRNFINHINPIKLDDKVGSWYYTENPTRAMVCLRFLRKGIYLLSGKKIDLPSPVRYKGMILAFPKADEFYKAAHEFLYSVMEKLRGNNESVVLDQLLLPHNLYRIPRYFDNDAAVIVVDRDPRDVFISNKYFWSKKRLQVPYPTQVDDFCYVYDRIRDISGDMSDKSIIRIHFEDLIYNYEDTIKGLFNKLGLSEDQHVNKKKIFKPEVSIVNTNLANGNEQYKEEAEIIKEKLSKYIYDFPSSSRNNVKMDEIF